MAEKKGPLEIERKFLIRKPAEEVLKQHSDRHVDITQIYLLSGPEMSSRRIRLCDWEDGPVWTYTEKERISGRSRIEREQVITSDQFAAYLREQDSHRRPIQKTRWFVPYAGHTLEIDVFPFWDDRAFCEAELASETEPLELPDWIRVVREVTEDPRYTNSALAREIPADPI